VTVTSAVPAPLARYRPRSAGLATQILPERATSACQTLRPAVAPVGGRRTAPTRLRRFAFCPVRAASDEVAAADAVAVALNLPGPRNVRVPRLSSRIRTSLDLSVMTWLSGTALPAGKALAEGPDDRTTRTAASAATAPDIIASAQPASTHLFIL